MRFKGPKNWDVPTLIINYKGMARGTFGELAERRIRKEITERKNDFIPMALEELMKKEFPPVKWKVDGIIPTEGLTIVSAPAGGFKTWLLFQMALDIARGTPFLDNFQCEQGKILMIDEENHIRDIQERFKLLGSPENLPIHFLSQQEFDVMDSKKMNHVLEICKKESIDTVFMDSLVRIHSKDENASGDMASVFKAIRVLCKEGKTVIVAHHERKEAIGSRSSGQNRLRGSSDISAALDAHLAISRTRDDRYRLIIEQPKNRRAKEIETFVVRVQSEEGRVWFENLGKPDEGMTKKEEASEVIPSILQEHPEGLTKSKVVAEIGKLVSVGAKNTQKALDELISSGVVITKKGIGNTTVCFLKEPDSEEVSG